MSLVQFPTADSLIYPLVDGDSASAVAKKDEPIEFVGVNGDYGNLYWSNEDASQVISWRGSPHRYYRIPDDINIPSLSRYFSGRPMMTVFSNLVYQAGTVLASTPYSSPIASYIMGASYPSSLIVVALQDTESSFDTVVWITDTPDPDTELCKWVEIGRWNTGRTELPWFPTTNGMSFTSATGATISVSADFKLATYSGPLVTNGVASFGAEVLGKKRRFPTIVDVMMLKFNGQAVSLSGDTYWESIKFTQTYQGDLFFDNDKKCSLVMQSTSTSPTVPQGASVTYQTAIAKLAFSGELGIAGPEIWNNNPSDYTATGAVTAVKWTYPTDTCGPQTISVEDNCGHTASKDVIGGGGRWIPASPDQTVDPLDLTSAWTVNGSLRTRLVQYLPDARACYIDGLETCPGTSAGWDADWLYLVTGMPGTTYGSCNTGAPAGAWWNGIFSTTNLADQFCPAVDPCASPYSFYAGGYAIPVGTYPDFVITTAGGINYAWHKKSRTQMADGWQIETEEFVCP